MSSMENGTRFTNQQKKLVKSMKFQQSLRKKIDMRAVNLDSIKPWIAKRVTGLLGGIEDEVVIGYILELLESSRFPDPKKMQIDITGFLNGKNARIFMGELWSKLYSAQVNVDIISADFLEKKKEEIRQQKEERKLMVDVLKKIRSVEADSTSKDHQHDLSSPASNKTVVKQQMSETKENMSGEKLHPVVTTGENPHHAVTKSEDRLKLSLLRESLLLLSEVNSQDQTRERLDNGGPSLNSIKSCKTDLCLDDNKENVAEGRETSKTSTKRYWVDDIPEEQRTSVPRVLPPLKNLFYSKQRLNRDKWKDIERKNIDQLLKSKANMSFYALPLSFDSIKNSFRNNLIYFKKNFFKRTINLMKKRLGNQSQYFFMLNGDKRTDKASYQVYGVAKVEALKEHEHGVLVYVSYYSVSNIGECDVHLSPGNNELEQSAAKILVEKIKSSLECDKSEPVFENYFPWCGVPPLMELIKPTFPNSQVKHDDIVPSSVDIPSDRSSNKDKENVAPCEGTETNKTTKTSTSRRREAWVKSYWVDDIPEEQRSSVPRVLPPLKNLFRSKQRLNPDKWKDLELKNIAQLLKSQANISFYALPLSFDSVETSFQNNFIYFKKNEFQRTIDMMKKRLGNHSQYFFMLNGDKRADKASYQVYGVAKVEALKEHEHGVLLYVSYYSVSNIGECEVHLSPGNNELGLSAAKILVEKIKSSLECDKSEPVFENYFPWCEIPPLMEIVKPTFPKFESKEKLNNAKKNADTVPTC